MHTFYKATATLFLSIQLLATNSSTDTINAWSQAFGTMLQTVQKRDYLSIPIEEAMVNAMNGFLRFDPHAQLLNEKKYISLFEIVEGELCGIGVVVAPKEPTDELVTILDVFEGGPADLAGIQPHEKIVAIEETPVCELNTDEMVCKLKGKEGSQLNLTLISSKGLPRVVQVKRGIVKNSQCNGYFFKNDQVAYVAIRQFSKTTVDIVKSALQTAQHRHARGLIIDLRCNGGGAFAAGIHVAELFMIPGTTIVSTKDRAGKTTQSYTAQGTPLWNQRMPLIILTDGYSASAAEILTGALSVYGAAQNLPIFTLGTATNGKASVQDIIPLPNNCALKLTTALYCLPDNRIIQGEGITPNFEVERLILRSEEHTMLSQLFSSEKRFKSIFHPTGNGTHTTRARKKLEDRRLEELDQDNQVRTALSIFAILPMISASKHQEIVATIQHIFHLGTLGPAEKLALETHAKART